MQVSDGIKNNQLSILRGKFLRTDLQIHAEIMRDVDTHVGQSGHIMPRYKDLPYPQRLTVLNELLRAHTLRAIGDVKRYIAIQKEIVALDPHMGEPPLLKIMQWLDREMDAITPVTVERDVVVLSLLAFGPKYIDRMLKYTLKSLAAPGNLPALAAEKKVILYIQTDAASRELIEAASIVASIKALGVAFDYTIIPDEIIATLDNADTTYWMLGAGTSLGIHYAKALRGVFHHGFPDMLYSGRFFSELLRLSKEHQSILCGGMRSDETRIAPYIAAYEMGNVIDIPAADLIAHHMNNIHMCAWPYVVNNRQYNWQYPQNHILIWESPETITINGPHLNPLWIDYSVLKDTPRRFYWTLDSELDMICKGENFYIPQECDDLYQAEISEPNRQIMSDEWTDATRCALGIWKCIAHRDMLKFFLRGHRIKLNQNIRRGHNAMAQHQVDAEMKYLFNALMATDPHTENKGNLDRTHAGRVYG